MSKKKRNRNFWILIPVCLCAILVIANLIQYFYFYRVLDELYEICKKISGENVSAFIGYANNLETNSLLTTGLTLISIAVAIWLGLNIYNVVNKQDVEDTLESYKETQKEIFENYEKRIDDSDEEREKKVQYLTRKTEFANLLYLTGERYYASDFFANLFWNTATLTVLLNMRKSMFIVADVMMENEDCAESFPYNIIDELRARFGIQAPAAVRR